MKISIITTTYNQLWSLKKLWQSVKAQAHTDWEWIVVDDGSKDKTFDFMVNLCKKHGNIEYIWQNDRGYRHSRAIDLAIRIAKGNICFLVFGDSYLNKNTLRILNRDYIPGTAGQSSLINVDKNGSFHSDDFRNVSSANGKITPLTKINYTRGNGTICDTKIGKEVGWDHRYVGYGRCDWDFMVRLKHRKVPILSYNTVFINHFWHPQRIDVNVKLFEELIKPYV